jgi:ABC-type sugar transport system permease subunit
MKSLRRYSSAYLFVAPFFLIYAFFNVYPLLYSIWMSLNEWDGVGIPLFVGLANFSKLFRDSLFWTAFLNNMIFALAGTIPCIILALALAALLDSELIQSRAFNTVSRVLLFTPVVTSTVAIGIVFTVLYGTKYGLINAMLHALGMQKNIEWLSDPAWMKGGLLILLLWHWLGYQVVFFTAGLKGIPRTLYEAAKMDGARGFQKFLYITIPILRPVTLFIFATSIISIMQLFEEPLVLSGIFTLGGAKHSLLTMMVYLYKNAFSYNRLGYASAITWLMLAIILVLTLVNLRFFGEKEK